MMDTPTPVASRAVDRPSLTQEQRALLQRAIDARFRATRVFTEPVAAVVVDALTAYIELGHRFEQSGKTIRLIDDILARPCPALRTH